MTHIALTLLKEINKVSSSKVFFITKQRLLASFPVMELGMIVYVCLILKKLNFLFLVLILPLFFFFHTGSCLIFFLCLVVLFSNWACLVCMHAIWFFFMRSFGFMSPYLGFFCKCFPLLIFSVSKSSLTHLNVRSLYSLFKIGLHLCQGALQYAFIITETQVIIRLAGEIWHVGYLV